MVNREEHAVEAARSVLLELMGLLSKHRASVVVIGGWAADLLPSKGIFPHAGTVDVDLVLDSQKIPEQDETTIAEVLLSKGYRKGRERFQYFRTVVTDLGPIDVRVDFLTPESGTNVPGGSYRAIQGVDTLTLRGGDLAFAQTLEREVEGTLPDGENVVVSVRVTSTVPFLVLKSLALFDRRERKDAYDIYHRLKNYPGNLEDLVNEFEPYLDHELVQESLARLVMFFSRSDSEGPRFVADFMAPEDPEEKDVFRRDAYELVNFLLEELGIRDAES